MLNEHQSFAGLYSASYWVQDDAWLAIKAGASPLVASANAVKYYSSDTSIAELSAWDMPALVWTVTNGNFNVFVFAVEKATGSLITTRWTGWDSLDAITFPEIDVETYAVVWYVIINPTGTGDFVWGTTALDDGTVVPNADYVDLGSKRYIGSVYAN